MAAGGRVSIPAGARRTIAGIKEIAGGHSDEEVYAVLRECNMDPNETVQKLLLQDTFHEVKSKRDKKKVGNKEPSDSRWRPVMQGRGGKGGRGNNSSRHLATTTDPGGRIGISGKENEVNQSTCSSVINLNMDIKTSISMPSLPCGLSNGLFQPAGPGAVKKNSCDVGDMPKSDSIALVDLKAVPPCEEGATAVGPNVPQSLKPPTSVLGSCASAADPVLVPSSKSHSLGDVGAAKQASGSQWTTREHNAVCCDLPMDTKVVSNKEWKPKPTSITAAQATENVIVPDDVPLTAETVAQSAPISNSVSKEDLLKVDKRFDDLQLPHRQHVIIPDHLKVSESEKYGLSFGSFGTSFQQAIGSSIPECVESSSPSEYGSSQKLNDTDNESTPRDQDSSNTVPEAADPDPQQLLVEKLEKYLPLEVENPSSPPEVTGSNLCADASATSGIPQSSIVQTTRPYLTQLPGNQTSALGTSQSQGSYSSLLASSGSAPLAIPATGVVPASIAIPQQSVPVFRHLVGVHLPHYPPNYIPYNQYISPYFIPPPTMYPFLGNAAFTQPPSAGPMYPAPGSVAIVPPVKCSAPSFKPAGNTGSQASVGIPGAYGTYGSSPSAYTDSIPVSNGNPAENDDASSQFKENSIYIAGQQSEGSTVWIPAPGRDMYGLQASSFYGLHPQGQHIRFAPGQASHSPFGGIYHPVQTTAGHPLLQPSQTMAGAVELTGPPGSIYQQQQTQINWGHN